MPYITREDGQHFVIPSYRDVLMAKQKSQLKKDILALSKSYGEYITLQKKAVQQYEVAFSSDTGYLLGESIWSNFKKPLDMVYCEAIPNTTEAILVIVKAGSVYLDGSFPVDSIPEELIVFLTQQNNFEIYTYGDVPVSKEAEGGKFSFEAASVKSFTVLDKPVFPSLPLLKVYQLKLVDTVLKEQGVTGVSLKPIVMLVVIAGLAWFGYSYFSAPPPPPTEQPPNPFEPYFSLLNSPAPDEQIGKLANDINILLKIPGWSTKEITYAGGSLTATLLSDGGTIADLYAFAEANKGNVSIQGTGVRLSMNIDVTSRPVPDQIYSTQKVLGAMIDRISRILPGNTMQLSTAKSFDVFSTVEITINIDNLSPAILELIGKQLSGLPLVLDTVKIGITEDNSLTGSIIINAVGS